MSDNEIQNEELNDAPVPSTEEEADALLAGVEGSDQPPTEGAPTQAQVDAWNAKDWAFKTGGREVLPQNKDQLRKWAEMGYSAPHKIGELQKEISSWKSKQTQIDELHGKYSEIDSYVQKNPAFWQHVEQSWQQRNQLMTDPNNPLAQTVGSLQQQMQELMQTKQQWDQHQKTVKLEQQHQQYFGDLDKMKKAYPKVDFDSPDESGKSLEYKVLAHAQERGINNFTTAFRDFYHDQLIQMATEDAKEKVAKDRQKNTKMGIIGKSPTPTRGVSSDVRGKSYGDLASEALRELGIG